MKNSTYIGKKFTKVISLLCLLTCYSSIAISQTVTWSGSTAAPCPGFSLSVSANQLSSCGFTCGGNNCDQCVTLDITNTSTTTDPCDITQLDVDGQGQV